MDSILQESNVIMKSGENYKKFEKEFYKSIYTE